MLCVQQSRWKYLPRSWACENLNPGRGTLAHQKQVLLGGASWGAKKAISRTKGTATFQELKKEVSQ